MCRYRFQLLMIVSSMLLDTLGCISQAMAQSPLQHEMEFRHIHRDRFSFDCGRACENWLVADGLITKDTPKRFSEFISNNPIAGKTIYFNSVGGSLTAAVELASLIRKFRFDTAVGRIKTIPRSGERNNLEHRFQEDVAKGYAHESDRNEYFRENEITDGGSFCYSECVYAFLGGVSRTVGEQASLGVRQFGADGADPNLAPKPLTRDDPATEQKTLAELSTFVSLMGVDSHLVTLATDVPPNAIHFLSPAEMSDLRVIYDPRGPVQTDWSLGPYFGGLALVASEQILPYGATQPNKNTISIFCLQSKPQFYIMQIQYSSEVLPPGEPDDNDGRILSVKLSSGAFNVEREKVRFYYSFRDSDGSEIAALLLDRRTFERAIEANSILEIGLDFPVGWELQVNSRMKTEGMKSKLRALLASCLK